MAIDMADIAVVGRDGTCNLSAQAVCTQGIAGVMWEKPFRRCSHNLKAEPRLDAFCSVTHRLTRHTLPDGC